MKKKVLFITTAIIALLLIGIVLSIKEVFQSESEIRKLGEIIQSQIDVDKEEKKESDTEEEAQSEETEQSFELDYLYKGVNHNYTVEIENLQFLDKVANFEGDELIHIHSGINYHMYPTLKEDVYAYIKTESTTFENNVLEFTLHDSTTNKKLFNVRYDVTAQELYLNDKLIL